MPFTAALNYSRARNGKAIVVTVNGETVAAEGQNGFPLDGVKDIESGSKTFSAVIAMQLIADGHVASLDAKVSDIIIEWQGASPQKENCTLRQLLSQTSGLAPGQTGSNPTYEQSIAALMPATQVGAFRYGPNSFGVFGAYVKRLVQPLGFAHAADYLQQCVLTPIGVTIQSWDYVAPNQPHLAGGAHTTARDWVTFGEWLRNTINPELITSQTASPDPLYGIAIWLCMDSNRAKPLPNGGFAAAGANNQRLVILPAQGLVCARFGGPDSTWSDEEFVSRLVA